MKCLVVHSHPQSSQALQAVIDCAHQITDHVDAIIIGPMPDNLALNNIWHYADLEHPSSIDIADIICQHDQGYSHILCHADTAGKEYLPYFCGRKGLPMISDVCKINQPDTFERLMYAGDVVETVQSSNPVKALTVRGIYFTQHHQGQPTIHQENWETSDRITLSQAPVLNDTRPDLGSAYIVVSGGRGFGSKESFDALYDLASHFNAAVGASRAAVDAGYIGNDHQVGQTGKQIAPKYYFSFGISGAVQHLAGMKNSQVIIAIDKDPDAPIFNIADYGYVGDLFDAISALKNKHIS